MKIECSGSKRVIKTYPYLGIAHRNEAIYLVLSVNFGVVLREGDCKNAFKVGYAGTVDESCLAHYLGSVTLEN